MSSVGQVVGGIVGAVIGFFAGGNVVLGASIGMAIGGYIDPPKGPTVIGPRLDDLSIQTSTYGAVLPRIKGTIAVTGNVFWLEGDKYAEHENTQSSGGKGGGSSATSKTFSYSATFAVGLAHCTKEPISGIRRLWLANRLVYDAGSDDLNSIIASNTENGVVFRFYDGSDDQQPDPRMQADKGIANVSGFPGRSYIVFYDLDLTEHYSNALMATQVKAELATGTVSSDVDLLIDLQKSGSYTGNLVVSATLNKSYAEYGVFSYNNVSGLPQAFQIQRYDYAQGFSNPTVIDISTEYGGSAYYLRSFVCQTDQQIGITVEGVGYPTTTHVRLHWHLASVSVTSSDIPISTMGYGAVRLAVREGTETWFCTSGAAGGPDYLYRFDGAILIQKSSSSYNIGYLGLSENYLFGVYEDINSQAAITTTVYKFDRTALTLVDTYTFSINGCASIQCVSDIEFYLFSTNHAYRCVNGSIINDLGGVVTRPLLLSTLGFGWSAIFSEEPVYSASIYTNTPINFSSLYIGHNIVQATPAKLHDIITDECAIAGISSSDIDLSGLTNHDVRGYKIATLGSARSALEPLQAAFPFDVIQSGYKIKFKDRGSSSIITIPESDIGAKDEKRSIENLLPEAIEMPSEISSTVAIQYYNADREYDIDEQSSSNNSASSRQTRTINLPIVFTAEEALRSADVLLKKEWIERRSFGPFTLPPTYRNLEAADVITIQYKNRNIEIRITKATDLANGIKEIEGRMTSSAAYTSTAIAQSSLVLGQVVVPLRGASVGKIMDIPRIVSDQDQPGVSASIYGYTSGWPGAILFYSDDFGQSWSSISSSVSKGRVFVATNSIGYVNEYSQDSTSILSVVPAWDGADIYSVTETQLYSHTNLAAYGIDGRWEIVSFKTVSSSSGSFLISDFLRGLFGTGWAGSLHENGDALVMLDATTTKYVGLSLTAINTPRLWRVVTLGASLDSAVDINNTYHAANLRPLSPVDINGNRNPTTGEWTISASRRSRWPVELFSGISVPVGETSESYELEIYDSSYSTLKRTISASGGCSFSYPLSSQNADFGIDQSTIYLKMYQLSSVVGRGYPLKTSIFRAQSADPFIDNVVLLLNMQDVGLTDARLHTVTLQGDAARTSAQSPFAGGTSAVFDGTGDSLSIPDSPDFTLSGDFTIEGWVWVTGLASEQTMISHWYGGVASNCAYGVGITTTGKIIFRYGIGGTNASVTGTTQSITTGSFKFISVTRSGSSVYLHMNGQLDATIGTVSGALNNCPAALGIGVLDVSITPIYRLTGYIGPVRMTKAARYSNSNYTPPTAVFPNP